jgi:5-methyltetrahydrofolate--homocysteine methyltransferase
VTRIVDIRSAVVDGALADIPRLIQEALGTGTPPHGILHDALLPAMEEVGRRMQSEEMFIPEVLRSAQVMQLAMDTLRPYFGKGQSSVAGTVVIGTVKGDLHDIGASLVGILLRTGGFEVQSLGVDVDPSVFVAALRDQRPDILALSAGLTSTMPYLKNTIDAIVQAGLRKCVKIVVGGTAVTSAYADKIGADGYGADAVEALTVARQLVRTSRHSP